MRWNNCDEYWKNGNSLFKRRFHCRHRPRILRSLMTLVYARITRLRMSRSIFYSGGNHNGKPMQNRFNSDMIFYIQTVLRIFVILFYQGYSISLPFQAGSARQSVSRGWGPLELLHKIPHHFHAIQMATPSWYKDTNRSLCKENAIICS